MTDQGPYRTELSELRTEDHIKDSATTTTEPPGMAKLASSESPSPVGSEEHDHDNSTVATSRGSTPRSVASLSRRLGLQFRPRAPRTYPQLNPVLQPLRTHHPKVDTSLVTRAFEVAQKAHDGQLRKNGDPFISHPLAVATILAEIGQESEVLAAALLHDVVEDTDIPLSALADEFGKAIAQLVDGVTKLDKFIYGDSARAETFRKMLISTAKDRRVMIIKLADRLHNARTWRHVPPAKARTKAEETLEIYAPLAHRMGINVLKWELEDRAFQVLYPGVYDEIERKVAEEAPARDEYLKNVRAILEDDLKAARIKADISGRPKHYYSIYQKMVVRQHSFSDINDLIGIRILVSTQRECYAVLGAIHARWAPVPGRFKDYIARPKFNMYQSLHTTVIGPGGRRVELQIRTHEMHTIAELGHAAHWQYKESMRGKSAAGSDNDEQHNLMWLKQVLDWQRETSDPGEFLDSLRFEVNAEEIYVFTPKGKLIVLPQGSTPLDFAFAVHTEVGHHTMGCRVNGAQAALDTQLENGDRVEVLTSKAEARTTKRDWLQIVKSQRARAKVRQHFSKERREESIESGRDAISKVMRKKGLPVTRLASQEAMVGLSSDLNYANVSALYAAVGEGHVSAASVVEKLLKAQGGDEAAVEDVAEATIPSKVPRRGRRSSNGVEVGGDGDVWTKLAKCCTPIPGDDIVGYVTVSNGVTVHRVDCVNVSPTVIDLDRLVDVRWSGTQHSVFLAAVTVRALDRSKLLADVSNVLHDHHVSIVSATVRTDRQHRATLHFTFEIGDIDHVHHIKNALENVDGVYEVLRTNAGGAPRDE